VGSTAVSTAVGTVVGMAMGMPGLRGDRARHRSQWGRGRGGWGRGGGWECCPVAQGGLTLGTPAGGAQGGGWGAWGWAGAFFPSTLTSQGTVAGASGGGLHTTGGTMQLGQPAVPLGYTDVAPSEDRTIEAPPGRGSKDPLPLSRGDRNSWWAQVFAPWYTGTDRRKLDEDSLSGGSGRRGHHYGHTPGNVTPRSFAAKGQPLMLL